MSRNSSQSWENKGMPLKPGWREEKEELEEEEQEGVTGKMEKGGRREISVRDPGGQAFVPSFFSLGKRKKMR
jgi:hypothetical protein